MKKRRFLFLLLMLFSVLGALTFFGDKGIFHLLRLKKELSRLKEDNRRIEAENQKLREEVRRLQSEKRYIEEIARKELGMVKGGEIIYQFDSTKYPLPSHPSKGGVATDKEQLLPRRRDGEAAGEGKRKEPSK